MMTEKGKLNGRHVLIMLVVFFGVMIFANFVFVRAALKTFPGVSEDHSYLQGLHYNETLAARAEQAKLGWAAEVTEVAREGETGFVRLRMSDGDELLSGLVLSGALRRPADDDEDQPLAFKPLGEGVYEAEIAAFTPGAWDLHVRAESRYGDAFDIEARIIAP